MKNKTRYIPLGFTKYEPEIGDYPADLFACYVDLVKLSAIFYTGKQTNHTWYNRFHTVDDLKKKVNATISNIMAWEDKKLERKQARKAPGTLKVGDILHASWGYDQTNANFYQVLKTIGKQTVEIREIGSEIVSGAGGPTTHVVPVKDAFLTPRNEYDKTGTVLRKRVLNGRVRVYDFATAGLWDGKPCYETGSGWGH